LGLFPWNTIINLRQYGSIQILKVLTNEQPTHEGVRNNLVDFFEASQIFSNGYFFNHQISKELFLEAVRQFQCVWDTTHNLYKDRNAKANALKQLSAMFNVDGTFC